MQTKLLSIIPLGLLIAACQFSGVSQTHAANADLGLFSFEDIKPTTFKPGEHPSSLKWGVDNFGPSSVGSSFFQADVIYTMYLSRNSVFGDADDLFMGSRTRTAYYPAGASVLTTVTSLIPSGLSDFTIPSNASGTYHVFLQVGFPLFSTYSDPDRSDNHAMLPFTITVNAGCAASTIANQTINEGGSTGPLAFNIGSGTAVTAKSSNAALVPDASIVLGGTGSDRTVSITPLPDQSGTASITLTVTCPVGTSTSSFNLTVNPVNDPPVFTKGADQTFPVNSGTQTIPAWATGINVGPANESSQTATFLVTADNDALFAVLPAIASDGTLTYTPAANKTGSANITVRLKDDGGTANGGNDTSAAQQFKISSTGEVPPPTPAPAGLSAGDFSGDKQPDLILQHALGSVGFWLMNGTSIKQGVLPFSLPAGWRIAAAGGFDGDDQNDLVLQHTDGSIKFWFLHGTKFDHEIDGIKMPPEWKIAGAADFDGDGYTDLIAQHADGSVAFWFMKGTALASTEVPYKLPAGWKVAGTGSFNADDDVDILLQHSDGTVAFWLMDGTKIREGRVPYHLPAGWQIVATGDFNGDQQTDILLQHDDGTVGLWLLRNTAISQGLIIYRLTDPRWQIVGPR